MIWLKDKRTWILLGFYGVLAILFHMFWLKLGGGDDYYFMTCLDDTSFGAFMVKRWYGWSSRLVIEGVLVLVLQQPIWVWKVLDILVSVLIAWLLCGFFCSGYGKHGSGSSIQTDKNTLSGTRTAVPLTSLILFLCLLLSYDFTEMDSAGYMTTTINYWWPLAALLVAALPLYLWYQDGACKKGFYVLGAFAAIFAINQEQICAMALLACLYLLITDKLRGRKTNPYLYLLLTLSIFFAVCVVICPGNAARKASNIDFWFPAYAGFSLVQKILLGWYSLLKTLYQDLNLPYLLMTMILLAAVWKKQRSLPARVIAAIPLLSNLGLLGVLLFGRYREYPWVHLILHVFDFDQPVVYYQGSLPDSVRILLLVYTLCCICVVISLFLIWGRTKRSMDTLALLVIASASKISMGLSPTVWASSERTSIFLDFGFILFGMLAVRELERAAETPGTQADNSCKI